MKNNRFTERLRSLKATEIAMIVLIIVLFIAIILRWESIAPQIADSLHEKFVADTTTLN